ncbi:MAG: mechanosensitive ion channel domain-containing protein [Candidatus Babeliales bacterium]
MRKIIKIILTSILLVGIGRPLLPAGLIDTSKIFVPERDEREEQLTHLKEEYTKLQAASQEKLKLIQEKLEQINKQTTNAKAELKEAAATEQEFLNKKVSILNEIYQVLFNIQFIYKELLTTVEQHVKLLEEYKKDSSFKALVLEPRSFYSYEIVQNAIKKVFDQEDRLKILQTQKNDISIELENAKKKLISTTKSFQEKKKEQEEFAVKTSVEKKEGELGFKERGELLDLEKTLEGYQQELAELRTQALSRKISFINTNLFIESEKLKILKNNLARAKSGLRIAEAEIQDARENLEKRKQKSLATKETHYDEIKKLSAMREKLRQELEAISKRYKLPILEREEFATWSVETPTLESYSALCEMGFKNAQVQLLDRKIEYLRAQIQLEDVRFRREEIKVAFLETWHNLSSRKVAEGEEILQELKRFRELEAEINRELNTFQDRRNAATNLLNFQNKELNNLRNLIQEVQQEKDGVFKRFPLRYNSCLSRLSEAEKIIGEQIDMVGKLLEIYASAASNLNNTAKEISIILSELESKSIWQRSQYAISWQGIKNIIPDLNYFVSDFWQISTTYITTLTWKSIINSAMKLFYAPGKLIFIIFFIILIIVCYFALKMRLPLIKEQLLALNPTIGGLTVSTKILGCVAAFVNRNLTTVYLWVVLFIAVYFEIIPDLFLRISFYLISIPYLLFISRRFIKFFVACNRQQDYPIFTEQFERRFEIVTSIFFYISIILLFFREAFMLTTIHKSELPNILLAAYSIVLRTLIIFSIGKEEILALVSKRGGFWNWISYIIENYYYPLLFVIIAIMILSDPYVGGYRNLVSYFVWGLLGSIFLIYALYLIHTYAKKSSEVIFFSTEEETKKERFAYAKTWYGIFVITLFLLFIIIGIAVGIKVWGFPVVFEDIWKVLDFHIFSTGQMEQGEPIWFTPRKFLVVLSFIIAGFLLAIAFNRFVLQRIFDILPVDVGIQNTVNSITRYLILIVAIYLGFSWAGLTNLLIAIGLVIGSITYILKEPVGDFISYFIILVQRPIQIGDYIMISQDVQGVVRKITPRSIILRRKDSYSIILPNSMILTHPINNWSYARNFVAIEDIYLTISYHADPVQVKKIINRVLDENTDILKSPRPIIRLHEFGEYGFVFMIRGFISNINILRRWDIASDIRFSVIRALQEKDIRIAMPTRLILRDEVFTQQQPQQ